MNNNVDKIEFEVGKSTNEELNKVVDKIKIRQKMKIYAFTNPDIPDYVKVGDTNRDINVRLNEWRDIYGQEKVNRIFPQVGNKSEEDESIAMIGDIFFRDKSLHKYLMEEKGHANLTKEEFSKIKSVKDKHYSNEFFSKDGSETKFIQDVKDGIQAIKNAYNTDNQNRYKYYSDKGIAKEYKYLNNQEWSLRPNQEEVVKNFVDKVDKGQKKLLLYAVMRFGKSYTAMMCAKSKNYKKVLILSAKADVVNEWKKTVEQPKDFANYLFIKDSDLIRNPNIIKDVLKGGYKDEDTKLSKDGVVCFLTLQNLSGKQVITNEDGTETIKNVKDKLEPIFKETWDLVLVDETHFGAWAGTYGKPLKEEQDDETEVEEINEAIKANNDIKSALSSDKIKRNITLHLSGTPYNLLYQKEFTDENTICKVQFEDILEDKDKWDTENIDKEEWENPLFGFPTMLRFGFNLPEDALKQLKEYDKQGIVYNLNDLFVTDKNKSAERYVDGRGKRRLKRKREDKTTDIKFEHEAQVLELLKCIDGSAQSNRIVPFLDIPKIKDNKVCKHIVMVLPFKYSCDAMEQLLEKHKKEFKNLSNYDIINISGWTEVQLDGKSKTVDDIKRTITEKEKVGKMTISLTVNRMLTGVTVPEWDTMLMMKDTKSPQEYDQAIFRIQSQYIKTYTNPETGDEIKIDMKPQTILVDFSPNRMFEVLAKSIESTNYVDDVSKEANKKISREQRAARVLKYTNFIAYNSDKDGMVAIQPTNILDVITKYNSNESIMDTMSKLDIDEDFIIDSPELKEFINGLGEFNLSKLDLNPSKAIYKNDSGNKSKVKFDSSKIDIKPKNKSNVNTTSGDKAKMSKEEQQKLKTYMFNLLVYAFLTKHKIETLSDIVGNLCFDQITDENLRIASNLNLKDVKFIQYLDNELTGTILKDKFEYSLRNVNHLSHDKIDPKIKLDAIFRTFSRIGSDKVVTPMNVCKKVVAGAHMIPKDEYIKCVNNGEKILDIASKIGEFSRFIWEYLKNDVDKDKLRDSICCIPLDGVTYELTRKTYELLGLNVDNIATFNSYDLLELTPERANEFFERQNCKFSEIRLCNQTLSFLKEILKG